MSAGKRRAKRSFQLSLRRTFINLLHLAPFFSIPQSAFKQRLSFKTIHQQTRFTFLSIQTVVPCFISSSTTSTNPFLELASTNPRYHHNYYHHTIPSKNARLHHPRRHRDPLHHRRPFHPARPSPPVAVLPRLQPGHDVVPARLGREPPGQRVRAARQQHLRPGPRRRHPQRRLHRLLRQHQLPHGPEARRPHLLLPHPVRRRPGRPAHRPARDPRHRGRHLRHGRLSLDGLPGPPVRQGHHHLQCSPGQRHRQRLADQDPVRRVQRRRLDHRRPRRYLHRSSPTARQPGPRRRRSRKQPKRLVLRDSGVAFTKWAGVLLLGRGLGALIQTPTYYDMIWALERLHLALSYHHHHSCGPS